MGKYKRKTQRQSWDAENMYQAVEEILEGKMGYLKASKQYQVPRTTLEARVKKIRKGELNREESSKKKLGRHTPTFSPEQEEELAQYILFMEARLFGFSLNDLRTLAFELAERNHLDHRFNQNKKKAGKSWLYGFLSRHPNIKLRTSEPTSIARAMGFNRPAVQKYFKLLSDVLSKHRIPAGRIYNVDETGIMTVLKKRSKCLSLYGKKQVGCISSAERGVLVTVEICMSAAGVFMPPAFIFPRARAKPELLDDAPPGSMAYYHSSGWMQKEIFTDWFYKFIEFAKPSREKPVLLLLDGHSTHTKNLDVIEKARANNVILLCFPPHTTHRMQPLDVSFMAPLSMYYSSEVQKWMQQHPGRPVTVNQIGKLFGHAYMKAACVQTAVSGFRKCGVHPLNPDVFPDWMFAPAETTNRSMDSENTNVIENPKTPPRQLISPPRTPPGKPTSPTKSNDEQPMISGPISTKKFYDNPIPSCSNSTPSCSSTVRTFTVTPEQIIPIPHSERKMNVDDKRRGKTAVLSSTPYKEELEKSITAKHKKIPKRSLAKELSANSNKKIRKRARRQNIIRKIPKRVEDNSSSSEGEESSDTSCIYCTELYSNSKSDDGWVKCQFCQRWAHEACAGVDHDDGEEYSCDFCK